MATSYLRKDARNERALVSFRIVLPATTTPQSVHLLGSWDNFHTPITMEQDIRVGRGVWKYMITDKGGLEMGSEFTYYFLLDQKHYISDPGSPPEYTTVDKKTGRIVSILHVPTELPPSSAKSSPPPSSHVYIPATTSVSPASPLDEREKTISPVGIIGASIFAGSGSRGKDFEEPRRVPEHPTHPHNGSGSLRDRIKERSVRRVSSMFFGVEADGPAIEENPSKKRWSLVKKTSGFFRRNRVVSDAGSKITQTTDKTGEDVTPNKRAPAPLESKQSVTDIVGYLREDTSIETAQDTLSHLTQPPRAYYHSPVATNIYVSTVPDMRPQIPRSISDSSKKTNESTITSPSTIESMSSNCSCNEGSVYSCACSPMVQSAFSPESCSSDDDEEEEEDAYEVETPVDGLGITAPYPYQQNERVYPKYYNFDEITGHVPGGNRDIGKYAGDVILNEASYSGISAPKPLACLREEVAGELAWRDELVDELGYLGGVVI
ncbi:hypothetical protein DFP73DRAFT_57035 [Morchella snyderi]|nr:hypothetical protein DFP73DRAFT_57035 [Morchella snyderi]